jgi:poly(hydroxyalkanoate) granule-associated protein
MNRSKGLLKLKDAAIAKVASAKDAAIQGATRFEKAFESRVTRAMSRLGVPSAKEVRALSRQVAGLKASVEKLRRARA